MENQLKTEFTSTLRLKSFRMKAKTNLFLSPLPLPQLLAPIDQLCILSCTVSFTQLKRITYSTPTPVHYPWWAPCHLMIWVVWLTSWLVPACESSSSWTYPVFPQVYKCGSSLNTPHWTYQYCPVYDQPVWSTTSSDHHQHPFLLVLGLSWQHEWSLYGYTIQIASLCNWNSGFCIPQTLPFLIDVDVYNPSWNRSLQESFLNNV
jgi:hypothetical protein